MTSATAGRGAYGPERIGAVAAAGTLLGVVLSGPLAVLAVGATHPQPAWRDAATFARDYHPVQVAPYLGGLVLVVSLVLLVSAIHSVASASHRVLTSAALIFCSAFAAFILFNYVVQTTFLPFVARHFDPDDSTLVATLSMANPTSLAWGIEMWGWGFLGVATWLCAPVFHSEGLERALSSALVANGVVSVVGTFWTAVAPGWVVSPLGLVAFSLWNLLLAGVGVLSFVVFRRRALEREWPREPSYQSHHLEQT